MRIAISGSHRTGKSTLVSELSALLPTYATVDEPYHLMEEDGYDFSYPPSLEDFEAQLERSIDVLGQADDDVLLDRCPIDFLGYIALHKDGESFDLDEWIPRVRDAVKTLDIVVFVPIEARDRIAFPQPDDDATRAAVDEKLRELLLDDLLELGLDVLEVEGDPESRARAVLRKIRHDSR